MNPPRGSRRFLVIKSPATLQRLRLSPSEFYRSGPKNAQNSELPSKLNHPSWPPQALQLGPGHGSHPVSSGVCRPLGLATEREEEGTGQLFRLTGTCVVWHWASVTGLQVFKGPWPMREYIGRLLGTAHLRSGPTSPRDLSFSPSLWTSTGTLASVLWNKPLEMTPSRRLFLDKYI